jgi:hypothetical protein
MTHGAAFSGPPVAANPPILPKTYEISGLAPQARQFDLVETIVRKFSRQIGQKFFGCGFVLVA